MDRAAEEKDCFGGEGANRDSLSGILAKDSVEDAARKLYLALTDYADEEADAGAWLQSRKIQTGYFLLQAAFWKK